MFKEQVPIIMTETIWETVERAKIYLKAGLAVHLTGPSGVGKTTLALKLAKELSESYYFIQGDEIFTRNELVGGLFGYYEKVVEDNFIPSVAKMERRLTPTRVDNPLALACQEGAILVYDEFTRARPETNTVLLGILSERVILISDKSGRLSLIDVHPKFGLILTSNPQEYVGVHQAQDALIDRLVTIQLTGLDIETEALITARHSNLNRFQAQKIVRFVREVQKLEKLPHSTTRTSIMIGKVYRSEFLDHENPKFFIKCCLDIMGLESSAFKKLLDLWGEKANDPDKPSQGNAD